MLLAQRALERVQPSHQLAGRLLQQAAAHLATARSATTDDPVGALQIAYDAARKSAIALLAAQGLRATSRGGHKAVAEAVAVQFEDPFARLDRLRRRRNQAEYPDLETPAVTREDALAAVEAAQAIHETAATLLEGGRLAPFEG